jgi:DNA-binding CsgD family transcriptional regulator
MAQGIVGRETEIAAAERFLDAAHDGPAALIFEGEAGMGKTTVWQHAVDLAERRSYRLMTCRPAESEAKLSYAAVADLLARTPLDALSMPPPQRHAIDVALLRREAEGPPPDHRAVATAFLSTLTQLAERATVLVAVDDSQWLDKPSAQALEFAVRRLKQQTVGILASVRIADGRVVPLGLDRALTDQRVATVPIGPLSLASIAQIIRAKLDEIPSRSTLVSIHRASRGNPFFALEIARALVRSEQPLVPGEPLPIPGNVRQLISSRIGVLSSATHEILVAAAALSEPNRHLVASITGAQNLDAALIEAEQADVIRIIDGAIEFTHPLLASTVYSAVSAERRRQLHRRAAQVVQDEEERARHIALSANRPDETIATTLDVAARTAIARGAPHAAAELAENALRLTPEGRIEQVRRRRMEAAEYHFRAADWGAARHLLEDVIAATPPGSTHAEALWRLGTVRRYEDDYGAARDFFNLALAEAGGDKRLRAHLERDLAMASIIGGDVPTAAKHARSAVEHAESLGDSVLLSETLLALAFVEFFAGNGLPDDLVQQAESHEDVSTHVAPDLRPNMLIAGLLKWTDDFLGARARFLAEYQRAAESGADNELPFLLWQLVELEVWAGNWELAARYATECHDAAVVNRSQSGLVAALYAVALVRAHQGEAETARQCAEHSLALAQEIGTMAWVAADLQVLGFLELSLENPSAAHGYLGALADVVVASGLGDPGPLRFLPDEIEALVVLGHLDQARSTLEPFEREARRLKRIWGRAAAARCRGLLLAAEGDAEGALRALDRALVEHARLEMPFERGRTLLAKGQVQRRQKKKRAANETLAAAVSLFENLGATLWATRARHELRRIGLRPAAPLDLTTTEQRVAELAAAGLTNREVAAAVFMSPKTVESVLSRVYRKLSIRSRAELGMRLAKRQSSHVLRPNEASQRPGPVSGH